MPSIEVKIYLIDNKRQLKINPRPTQIGLVHPMHQKKITPYFTNAFGLLFPIYKLIITSRLVKIDSTTSIYQQLIIFKQAQKSSILPLD